MAVLLWCSGLCTFYAASNAIIGVTATILLPLYFSFCGAEAAIRFSLLLCVHSVILAAIPKAVKSIIPMAQLVLFVALLLLPINVTPFFAVWLYEKCLFLAEPVLSVIEAIQVVLFIMYASQSLVDNIEEQPVFVKSTVIGTTILSYTLAIWLGCGIVADPMTTTLEAWILLAVFAVSISVLVICLIKDEGIVSDASSVSFLLTTILWAMKQERLTSTNPLRLPKDWGRSISSTKSFLGEFLSMASSSISQLGQAQVILRNLVSPTYLLLAAIRVGSAVCFILLLKSLFAEKVQENEDNNDQDEAESGNWSYSINPLVIRLVFIFVYTEFLVRCMVISTHNSVFGLAYSSAAYWTVLPSWLSNAVYFVLYEVRLWRVLQLVTVILTYLFTLFSIEDDY